MKTLKTLGLIGASALALSSMAATPSLAQRWHAPARTYDRPITTSYVDGLSWRIDNAARTGAINWQEARAMHADLRRVQPIAYRVQTGVASNWEYRRLMTVVDRIESATRSYAYNRARPYGYRR